MLVFLRRRKKNNSTVRIKRYRSSLLGFHLDFASCTAVNQLEVTELHNLSWIMACIYYERYLISAVAFDRGLLFSPYGYIMTSICNNYSTGNDNCLDQECLGDFDYKRGLCYSFARYNKCIFLELALTMTLYTGHSYMHAIN